MSIETEKGVAMTPSVCSKKYTKIIAVCQGNVCDTCCGATAQVRKSAEPAMGIQNIEREDTYQGLYVSSD
jgi:hypothetical protein